jgi:Planctomycete extracellular
MKTSPRPRPRRKQANHGRHLLMESLEDRTLLALASNVFATFEGVLANPGDSRQIPISLTQNDFQPGGSKPVLGFHAVHGDGSTLDPAAVQITDATGHAIAALYSKNNVRTGSTDSLTLAQLAMGNYTLTIGGEGSTTGAYEVQV